MQKQIARKLFVLFIACVALFAVLLPEAVTGAATHAAETYQVVATTYYNTFSRAHPVLKRVRPGDTVITKTLDAGGQDEKDVRVGQPSNPLTGPFYVEGAEAGDALVVRFNKVRLNRRWGWSAYRLGLFSLSPESIEGLYPNRYKDDLVRPGRSNLLPWDIDLERQTVRLREPASQTIKLEFPAKPMIGCVGVAPTGDFAPTSGPSGGYGGNLDYNEIGEGAVVLPKHSVLITTKNYHVQERYGASPSRRSPPRGLPDPARPERNRPSQGAARFSTAHQQHCA
jgi:amidase